MRSRRAAFAALALLLSALVFCRTASAFDTPALTAEQRAAVIRIGNSFRVLAVRFKCADFVWGTISPDGREVYLRYEPPGADDDIVKRQLTVTVYALPAEPDLALKGMEELRQKIGAAARAREGALMVTDESFTTKDGQPALFLDYQTGAGSTRSRNAGVLIRSASDAAAFVQIEAHGTGRLEFGDADEIRRLADIVTLKDTRKDAKKP
jgi:hypothetical protein